MLIYTKPTTILAVTIASARCINLNNLRRKRTVDGFIFVLANARHAKTDCRTMLLKNIFRDRSYSLSSNLLNRCMVLQKNSSTWRSKYNRFFLPFVLFLAGLTPPPSIRSSFRTVWRYSGTTKHLWASHGTQRYYFGQHIKEKRYGKAWMTACVNVAGC